ncbi:DNA-3-methyladenine glycosylase I [Polluticaenibacter yanchengensis]|uniref:DNA-3-methyladenine glycosylase I n=1 Tax=Polluticaenibacter yanchengensis TaxID=3014562 RepID=A0ABT4UNE5_9BACT|nr:DNA-3-methyladenine glycosylase I [Chitinophagaceae bacterium LY-5]
MSAYCSFIAALPKDSTNPNREYHDNHYGYNIDDDNELFERLVLEINQAGLSWTTILNKQASFKKAYSNFDIKKVAKYKEADIERLLNDAGIIRNKLKVNAAIHNANVIIGLQKEHGSFKNWLLLHHPLTKLEWVKLFKKHFKFTGGEIVGEFLMSIGILPGSHAETCPVYKKLLKQKPLWLNSK